MAAVQISAVSQVMGDVPDAFRFNAYQGVWAAILACPLAFLVDGAPTFAPSPTAIKGMFFLSVFSSVIAFQCQIRAQKWLSASTASLIYLLESPFAVLFGYLALGESVSGLQAAGCVLILVASVGAILPEKRKASLTGA